MMLYSILPSEVQRECGNLTFSSTQILKYCFPKHDDQWRYSELRLPKSVVMLMSSQIVKDSRQLFERLLS